MRLVYTLLFILIANSFILAQIEEIPLVENPILKTLDLQKQQARATQLEALERNFQLPATDRGFDNQNTVYVISGESATFCKDTTFLTEPGASFAFLSCGMIDSGTASMDSTCITYAADAGLQFETDTVCVRFCKNATDCDTIQYPIVIKRANNATTKPLVTLNAGDNSSLCFEADTMALPAIVQTAFILSDTLCSAFSDFGTSVTRTGLCILYEAGNFSETDTVCLVVCDKATVCDTIKIPYLVQQDTIALPFFDDFTNGSPHPNPDNWLTQDVFINSTLAEGPPSVGVATFDGIDAGGSPYYGGSRPSDDLTSAYIDLSSYDTNDDVFLSFYIQPKGNGDAPEVQDSLILEFKNDQDSWETIEAYIGLDDNIASDSIPPFSRKFVAIMNDRFFYNGFQFRFKNKSANTGAVDLWHLDYVTLDAGSSSSIFEDVAFTMQPNDILNPYSSMPWDHFIGNEANELDQDIFVGVFNHADMIANAGGSSVILTEMLSGSQLFDAELFNGQEANIDFGVSSTRIYDLNSSDPLVFPNVWTGQNYLTQMQSSFGSDSLIFDLEYQLVSSLNTVSSNDTVHRLTVFDNYFAYDDGTAESNLAAKGNGTQIAVEFHANVSDSLRAIQLHIPRVNANVTTQLFNLRVWVGSLDSDPVYEASLQRPLYLDTVVDSLNGFTSYRLQDDLGNLTPVAIPSGTFYVGWQQASSEFDNAIPIGLDKNNPSASQFIFANTDGKWEQVPPFVTGALMIRPVVGSRNPPNTAVEESKTAADTKILFFPNPSTGQFNTYLKEGNYSDYEVQVFNTTGQLIYQSILKEQFDLSNSTQGVYFIKIRNLSSNQITNQKLIITK